MSQAKLVAYVNSFTSDKKYEIREAPNGEVYCSCPAYAFSKKRPRKTCKHLLAYANKMQEIATLTQDDLVNYRR